jgi:hypothetical protein
MENWATEEASWNSSPKKWYFRERWSISVLHPKDPYISRQGIAPQLDFIPA